MDIRIFPPEGMIETSISLPLSKSMYNRALVMDALTPAPTPDLGAPPCDDAIMMRRALVNPSGEINIDGAGTAMRFLTAYFAAMEGSKVTLDGNERMRHRPIGLLVDTLRNCGASIEYLGEEGYPPLRIQGKRLNGGTFDIDAEVSSQYISALMMVAPTFTSALTLNLKGDVASLPYIKMTLGMMQHRGIEAELYNDQVTINPGQYRPLEQSDVERDWSAASYWYSIDAMSAGWISLPGLTQPSLQGDSQIATFFERLGVVTGENDEGELELAASPEVFSRFEADLSETPDIVQTLAVACVMIGVPFHMYGLRSLRIKETDRLEALKNELAKISADVEIKGDNEMIWNGKRRPLMKVPEIDTYGDHRMAMAFAPAAIYLSGIMIKNAEVVSKSYPTFWDDMRTAGFTIVDVSKAAQQENTDA